MDNEIASWLLETFKSFTWACAVKLLEHFNLDIKAKVATYAQPGESYDIKLSVCYLWRLLILLIDFVKRTQILFIYLFLIN